MNIRIFSKLISLDVNEPLHHSFESLRPGSSSHLNLHVDGDHQEFIMSVMELDRMQARQCNASNPLMLRIQHNQLRHTPSIDNEVHTTVWYISEHALQASTILPLFGKIVSTEVPVSAWGISRQDFIANYDNLSSIKSEVLIFNRPDDSVKARNQVQEMIDLVTQCEARALTSPNGFLLPATGAFLMDPLHKPSLNRFVYGAL